MRRIRLTRKLAKNGGPWRFGATVTAPTKLRPPPRHQVLIHAATSRAFTIMIAMTGIDLRAIGSKSVTNALSESAVNVSSGNAMSASTVSVSNARANQPPGWSKEKKTGWGNCDVPPGQTKKYGCHPGYRGHSHHKERG